MNIKTMLFVYLFLAHTITTSDKALADANPTQVTELQKCLNSFRETMTSDLSKQRDQDKINRFERSGSVKWFNETPKYTITRDSMSATGMRKPFRLYIMDDNEIKYIELTDGSKTYWKRFKMCVRLRDTDFLLNYDSAAMGPHHFSPKQESCPNPQTPLAADFSAAKKSFEDSLKQDLLFVFSEFNSDAGDDQEKIKNWDFENLCKSSFGPFNEKNCESIDRKNIKYYFCKISALKSRARTDAPKGPSSNTKLTKPGAR